MSVDHAVERATSPVVYDPFTEQFQADPFPIYKRLRDEAPVYHNDKWNFWALSRYEDVRAALRDSETYLNFEGIDLDDTNSQGGAGNIPNLDNPRHDQLRTIVQRHFMPRSIKKLENDVRTTVEGLVDGFAARGTADIAQELSWPLPYEIFFDFLGLPEGDDREQLVAWSHGLKERDPDSASLTPLAQESTHRSREYLADMLARRRREPKNDLMSHIATAEIDGVPLAENEIEAASEIVGLVFGLYLAGIETTAGLISTLFHELGKHPDQQKALRENPSLIPNAVEEGLRFRTPLQLTVRTSTATCICTGSPFRQEAAWRWSSERRTTTIVSTRTPRSSMRCGRLYVTSASVKGCTGAWAIRWRDWKRSWHSKWRSRGWVISTSPATSAATARLPTPRYWTACPSRSPQPDHVEDRSTMTITHDTQSPSTPDAPPLPPDERDLVLVVSERAVSADGVVALTLADARGGQLPSWAPGGCSNSSVTPVAHLPL